MISSPESVRGTGRGDGSPLSDLESPLCMVHWTSIRLGVVLMNHAKATGWVRLPGQQSSVVNDD